MRHMSLSPQSAFLLFATTVLCVSSVGCWNGNALGLQDWQRDIIASMGGGLAGALLSDAFAGDDAAKEEPGPAGPEGPEGPPGPPIFSIFVDTFFGGELAEDLSVVPVRNEEPELGAEGEPLAYTVVIPSNFEGTNPINMRVLLYRSGPCAGDCFIFTVDARRFQLGASGPECLGGEAADCSDARRWIRVEGPCGAVNDGDEADEFIVVDLPLAEGGLEFGEISPGDVLAFELNTFAHDGGTYSVFGVEFSDAVADAVTNAEILLTNDDAAEACAQ
ncbi:MAG: hypothetical protein KKI02_03790 [Planctomycetes bacterium]|nr:hypothetical protein [Planctomycetota bacterium]